MRSTKVLQKRDETVDSLSEVQTAANNYKWLHACPRIITHYDKMWKWDIYL